MRAGRVVRDRRVSPSLTLDQLAVFATVVDCGGFAAAARELGRATSAVTYAMERLEQGLGQALFDRSTYRASLTDAGRALLPSTLRVLDEVRDLRAGLGTRGSAREREVSVVLDATFEWPGWIDTLAIFRAKFPSVDLRIRTEATGHVAAVIANGLADFGVLEAAESKAAALNTAAELTLPSIAVVARKHPLGARTAPLTGASLRGHVQLVLCDRLGLLTARGPNVLSKRTWRVSDLATKHALLKAGIGWGYLPRHVAMPDLRAGTLVEMTFGAIDETAVASRTMAIAHRQAHTLGPAARWLADGLATALE